MVVCVADPLIFLMLPRANDASSLALAQSIAMALGLLTLVVFAQANQAQWPPARDFLWSLFASAGMAALAAPFRDAHPGLLQMIVQMAVAGSFYALVVGLTDLAGLRTAFVAKIVPLLRGKRIFHSKFTIIT
jgi:hypothetical protein